MEIGKSTERSLEKVAGICFGEVDWWRILLSFGELQGVALHYALSRQESVGL